jgi:branched-chain amino acid transport system permease protein
MKKIEEDILGWFNLTEYLWFSFGERYSLPLAIVLAVIITAIVGVVLARLTLGRIKKRDFNVAVLIMCGMAYLYEGLMQVVFGKLPQSFPLFSKQIGIEIGGVFIATQSLWLIGVTIFLGVILFYFFGSQLYGKAMRATSQNPMAAQLVGINTQWMVSISIALSAGMGAIAGITMAPLTFVVYNAGWMFTMKGFVAAVLGGGLNSYVGAFVGGIVVGLIEAFTIGYVTSLFKDVILFTILILILLIRPTGILGKQY